MKKCLLTMAFAFVAFIAADAQCLRGNCMNGKGIFKYKSGAVYTGSFRKGTRHGYGTLKFSDGKIYQGNWVRNHREGKGKLTFASGNVYIGTFVKSKKQGKGQMRFANNDRYEGQWQSDLMQGQGTYHFADGRKYVGRFADDKPHGSGEMYESDGRAISGEWVNGKRQGTNAVAQTNRNNKPRPRRNNRASSTSEQNYPDCTFKKCNNKIGVYRYKDGARFVGMFINGRPEGEGTCYYADGGKYVGGWKQHAPHGKGILYQNDGRVIGAEWVLGRAVKRLESGQMAVGKEHIEIDKNKEVKIWSVIVGVGRYPHMQSLKYTDDDAYQIYAFLKSPEGGAVPDSQIKVLIDEDATRNNIIRSMRQIFLKADENDVVMMYFSGHGLDGAFVPVDYDGYNNRLKHDEVVSILNESRAKHKLVYADACHSGSMLAMKGNHSNMLDKYYKVFEETRGGIALMLSSKGEETSLEAGSLRQGIFSHYLMRGLKGEADRDGDKIVTVSELYKFVNKNVLEYSMRMQTPTLTGSFDPRMPVSIIRH